MKQLWERWAPLTGIISVACSLVGVNVVLNQPQTKDSNAKIVAYFTDHSHRVQGAVGFFVFLAGILFLLAFLGVLRERLVSAEGQPGRLTALAFGAGVASLPLWATSILLASAVSLTASESPAFTVNPDTFRLLSVASYIAWVAALFVNSVLVWATSAVALRTGVLPRWYAVAGIVVGVVQLFGLFLFPFIAWWLWIVVTAVLLVARRGLAPAAAPQPAL
jgi:Na+/melibiose symporter-like transporter